MVILLFGLGSIGKRHCDNLLTLRPDTKLIIVDPVSPSAVLAGISLIYRDWRATLDEHWRGADCAIIASPTDAHISQMTALAERRIPFYVEKPLWETDERGTMNDEWERMDKIQQQVEAREMPCAVGFQYRYHPAVQAARASWRQDGYMGIFACDDLISRYGPAVGGIMASHPIDLALWTLGNWRSVDLISDGVQLRGSIFHKGAAHSYFDVRMNISPRVSYIANFSPGGHAHLDATNEMYLSALSAWLGWVETGEHDGTLATLADGMAVMRVLDQVSRYDGERMGDG